MNFYEFILNNLPTDIAVFDLNHKYLFINPNAILDNALRNYLIGKDDYDYCRYKGISTELADSRREMFNKVIINYNSISNNIDNFINIVNESCGKIVFVLDICYLLNFIVKMKKPHKIKAS